MKANIQTFPSWHLLSWHPDVIGWHFTANMSYLFYHLYGYLTYSSVQVFPINWVICGGLSLYQNRPAKIARFSKRLILCWNMSIARFKIKMRHKGFYMNVSLKRTECFQKSSMSSSFGLSCNVAFVSRGVFSVLGALSKWSWGDPPWWILRSIPE